MIRWTIRIFLILVAFTIFTLFYLSFYGLETDNFNSTIQNKIKIINPNLDLEFQKINILLDLKKLELKVKITKPIIKFNNTSTDLSKLNLNISIKSFLKNEFALQRGETGLKKTNIKQFIDLANQVKPSPFLFLAKEIFNKGQIEGKLIVNFDTAGKIKDDYKITGSIFNFDAKILKKFNINKVNAKFELFKNNYSFYIVKGNINGIDLANSEFEINKENKNLNVKANLVSRANLKNIQSTLDLFQINLLDTKLDKSEISFDLKSLLSFQLEKYIKIKNLKVDGNGMIHLLNIQHKIDTSKVKEIFTNYNDSFQIADSEIKFSLDSNKQDIELKGLINLTNEYENFQSKVIFDNKKNNTDFDAKININSSIIKLSNLNYKKEANDQASLRFKGWRKKNEGYNFEIVEFKESNNLILIKDIEFNKKTQVNNLKELIVRTTHDDLVNNDFKLTKDKKIKIQGEIYDARPLLISLDKEDKRRSLSRKFNGELLANFKEVITDKEINLYKFSMISNIKKGKQKKFTAKGEFSENKFLDISMSPSGNGKTKIFQLYSDRAEPFISNYKFIKGFKGGTLAYESIYDDQSSNSNLKISNFKVSKVPALTQLLTLASLQGIADTLTGEGIRFSELEMDFNSKKAKKNVINIEEFYAIGPAISLLMEGYIVKKELVSLRGTLVPARTVNKVIGWIPVVGKILIGSKVGEGVFGVSFKMKGPPKDIKTTVNPIKTLTPRFITRTLEKIKNMKKKNEN
jgi:hypothetical protein